MSLFPWPSISPTRMARASLLWSLLLTTGYRFPSSIPTIGAHTLTTGSGYRLYERLREHYTTPRAPIVSQHPARIDLCSLCPPSLQFPFQAKIPFSEEVALKMLPLLRNDEFIERMGVYQSHGHAQAPALLPCCCSPGIPLPCPPPPCCVLPCFVPHNAMLCCSPRLPQAIGSTYSLVRTQTFPAQSSSSSWQSCADKSSTYAEHWRSAAHPSSSYKCQQVRRHSTVC